MNSKCRMGGGDYMRGVRKTPAQGKLEMNSILQDRGVAINERLCGKAPHRLRTASRRHMQWGAADT